MSCNKGDAANQDIRCRLVCPEVKTYQSEFYAATPPLEALRLILSLAADNPELEVSLVDISRAYLNAEIGREVYVELPQEAGADRSQVGLLKKCLYGTRDAAQGWERTYQRALGKIGARRGKSSSCIFHYARLQVSVVAHGDDFFSVGSRVALDEFEASLLAEFEGKTKDRLRAPGDEFRILNKIVRRTEARCEWEADQRHAELIEAATSLDGDSRELAQPGRKLTAKELEAETCELGDAEAHEYRARVARANFLAADRPNIAFKVKKLCRGMSRPTTRDADALKRLCRYLLGKPRVVWHYGWQKRPQKVDIMSDND